MFAFYTRPAAAEPQPQVVYQTPTARPDGRVVYIVQEGDSCLRIELLTGTKINTLRELNKLDQNCTIIPGKELLLMVVTPVPTATPNPLVTTTPLLPTPTPIKGNGKICVSLYNDVNGNGVHEDSEPSLAGGAVSITNRQGSVSETLNTTDTGETLCKEVPEGEYTISMAIPGGYNATKAMNTVVKVLAGDQAILEFGAQASSQPATNVESAATTEQPAGNNNLLLAIFGGILVAGGIGLGAYVLFTRR